MRKQRGLRRYYRNLESRNFFAGKLKWLNFESWFDFYHIHFDNHHYGNLSFKKRRPHLDAMFRHYALAEQEMLKRKDPFQLWLFINDFDSYEDALYFHTPNQNAGSDFPYSYRIHEGFSEVCNLKNPELIHYLDQQHGFKKFYGQYMSEDNPGPNFFCALYREGSGTALF